MLKISNIIQLNAWEPKKFLRTMVAIHFAMFGAIVLDLLGLEIPILRQVVCFVYLTFVPGIIILRLLKLHKLGEVETVLLSVGLSISFLMFSGFFLNSVFSFLKINSPLSFWNVVIFVTVLVAILCILSCRMDRYYQVELMPLKISRSALYLMLLPLLSIIGTYFVNFHNNNLMLVILIVLIALIPILVALNKIPSELFPLTLVVIAISLLFHNSLLSMYLTGWDVHQEYYTSKIVINSTYWNSLIYSNLNAMLSIVILPTVYSYFLKIDVAWVFKIVYPFIFSLVPLGLYCVYQRQIKNDKIAFYSVFFFMSFFSFFIEFPSLARQEIAELFFVLLLLLIVQDTLNTNIRNILLLIFGASLITSHYGLSYLYLLQLIFIFSIGLITNLKIKGLILPEFNLKKTTFNYFFAFCVVFLLFWYINYSNSSSFLTIVRIGDQIYTSIYTDFLNPANRDSNLLMAIGAKKPVIPSFERDVFIVLQLLTQFFISIGFIKIIIYKEFSRLKAEYFYLMIASFALLILSLIPNFAESLNMTRIYHIALLTLSPLFIIGGIFFIEKSINIINIKNKSRPNFIFLILILGVAVPYFLFNTGFVYEMTKDSSTSMSLSMERMKHNNITKLDFYNIYTYEKDSYSSRWYYKTKNVNKRTYADMNSRSHVLYSYGMTPLYSTSSPIIGNKLYDFNLQNNYYLYLNNYNVCDDIFVDSTRSQYEKSIFSPIFNKSSLVYSNGCGEIYEK